jgi:ubiquinone/menaquinone biosynthesis C-methylase UbiE
MRKVVLLLKLGIIAATSRSTRTFYDRVSPFYELLFTDHLPHIRAMADAVRQRFGAGHQIKVLDMACGTGALSRRLTEEGFCVTGLDFSFGSLCYLARSDRAIRLIQADAAALPFDQGSFDVVLCMGAWRHFTEPQRVLDEVHRVLRPGGAFLVGYFPPKLGGLLSVPPGRRGKIVTGLYGFIMRALNYADRTDQELEGEVLRLIKRTFKRYHVIQSHKREYLIFAELPQSPSPGYAQNSNRDKSPLLS